MAWGEGRLRSGASAAACAAAMLVATASASRAAEVTLPFWGEVTGVSGSYAAFLEGATRVHGSLTYEDSVADVDPDPASGIYPGGLVSLSASLPDLGFSWSASAGSLRVFPDTPVGDQFGADSPIGNPTGSPVNGFPIRTLGVLFFGTDQLVGDAPPAPGATFGFGNLFVTFQDDFAREVGQATVGFAVPAPGGGASGLAALVAVGLLAARRRAAKRR